MSTDHQGQHQPDLPFSASRRAGSVVLISGQVGSDPGTGEVRQGIEAQTRQAMDNVLAILAESGLSAADIVRAGVYLADVADFDQMNRVYQGYFTAPFPARTTIGAPLVAPEYLVEIDAVAVIPGEGRA